MGAMAIVVDGQHAAVQQIDARGQRGLQVGMEEIDARVNQTDFDMNAGGPGPGLRGPDGPDAPGNGGGGSLRDGG
ncbi:hypothetical protein D3C74_458350 [compost metagenome]